MTKELLFSITKKDLVVDFFSGTGAGGQHRNKHMNCVRIRHPESGAMATGQKSKSRSSNIKEALSNLVGAPKFKLWHSRRVSEISNQKTIEQIVDEMMEPENLIVEIKKDGVWEKEQYKDLDEELEEFEESSGC